jgi:sulfur carrier protein
MMGKQIRPSGLTPGDTEGEPARVDGCVLVNGQRHQLPTSGNLVHLLRQLGIDPDAQGVAVAVNDEVIRRPDWVGRRLAPGDHVEVVRAVQGG